MIIGLFRTVRIQDKQKKADGRQDETHSCKKYYLYHLRNYSANKNLSAIQVLMVQH